MTEDNVRLAIDEADIEYDVVRNPQTGETGIEAKLVRPMMPDDVRAQRKKQKEEEARRKRNENYWKAMITRREAFDLVRQGTRQAVEGTITQNATILQSIHIQLRTITEVLVSKGIVTRDELDSISHTIIQDIVSSPQMQQAVEEAVEEDLTAPVSTEE